MKRTLRNWGSAAAVVAVSLAAGTSDGASPKFDSLPEITLTDAPTEKDVPKDISGASRIEGLFTAIPKKGQHNYGPAGQRYVGLFVNEDDAKQYRENKLQRWGRRPADTTFEGTVTTCFSTMNHWEMRQTNTEWPNRFEQWPQLRSAARGSEAAKQSPDYQKVRAFRIERLAVGEGDTPANATLHLQEGWFDPVSLGAKQTAKYTAVFKHVATGPGGVLVFAARDKTAKTVEFLVYQPELEPKLHRAIGHHMNVRIANGHGSADCGHARLSLHSAPGTGEHGSVQLDVILPDDEKSKTKSEKVARRKPKTKAPADDDANAAREPIEIRIRSLVVHVGVSQGVKEKEPTTTISFGWHGEERRSQIF